ncbi:hypothetical protein BUALT_Bualt11G0025100 [Buddleja alternifolia]|uniref:Uncharacterized protein n=1 Tax=Buddleja alternifolia TaxID=168488 RepID=A0AAV6WSA9_9LAMI|nr:hypothetical protein BUALT_Bualt11G0025100 [Buddleja alternifolia]
MVKFKNVIDFRGMPGNVDFDKVVPLSQYKAQVEEANTSVMCYGGDRLPAKDDVIEIRPAENENIAAAENLIGRLAETEVRLERARAREAELSRQLDEMKKFVVVMEIVETYLRRRYREQQDHLVRLYSSPSSLLVSSK